MPWTSTAALPTGFPAQPPGSARLRRSSSPEPQPNELLGLPIPVLQQNGSGFDTHMHGLTPSERPVAPNRLMENKGCIKHCAVAHGNGARRGQALIVLHLDTQECSSSKDVPLGGRFLWLGRAMLLGVGLEPATHVRPSLPDWANNVGMRGSVCRGILPWFFPGRCVPKASV